MNSEESFILFLRSWWSETYNRPLKDPLLDQYTVYELVYEYYDRVERKRAKDEQVDAESDKIEESIQNRNLAWAEEEERKEREENEKKILEQQLQEKANEEEEVNEQWMEDTLKEEKEKYGEDFGEDIAIDF